MRKIIEQLESSVSTIEVELAWIKAAIAKLEKIEMEAEEQQ